MLTQTHVAMSRHQAQLFKVVNMSCWSVNSFAFSREKLHERFGASDKSNELTDQQDMFCFKHASTCYTSNNNEKKFD